MFGSLGQVDISVPLPYLADLRLTQSTFRRSSAAGFHTFSCLIFSVLLEDFN